MTDIADLIGTVRRFGLVGPLYEVVGSVPAVTSGEQRLRIRLVDSGEETEYPVQASLRDPVEF